MSEASRSRILERLRASTREEHASAGDVAVLQSKTWTPAERIVRLRRMMEAVKAEFLEADHESWPSVVREFLAAAGARTLLYAPDTEAGRQLAAASAPGEAPTLIAYDRPIEAWKSELFASVDASITTTRGAIAETGSLIVWPSRDEPRLMSLVPPIHVALLEVDKIHDSLWQVMRDEQWSAGMPPNALLISGPSKTADIEQTLAYGVYGPKRLVVVMM
ncbi:MAG TPA: lactate utilization protein, partial [Thermoanaerobaculia bacterium]|nr:lactate utilization protein [Thermoanaerobaculia bacterium]